MYLESNFLPTINMRNLLKLIYTWFFNFYSLVRIKQGRNVFVHKGLEVHSPIGISLGSNIRIGKDARLSCYYCEGKLGTISIGDDCYIGNRFSVIAGAPVIIKQHCLIASDVAIISENHGMDCGGGIKYGQQELTGSPVCVEKCCWIGEKVVILPGVNIGEWSIIGAGAVVTHNIPSYSIAVGNPAKIIRRYNHSIRDWEKCVY